MWIRMRWIALALCSPLALSCVGGGGGSSESAELPDDLDGSPFDAAAPDDADIRPDQYDPGSWCHGESEPISYRYNACLDLLGCVRGCNDEACIYQCHRNASDFARDEFHHLRVCADSTCPELDEDCLRIECADTWDSCAQQSTNSFDPPLHSCLHILTCANECETAECLEACTDRGYGDGLAAYEAALDCVETHCPDHDSDCQQAECGAELDICTGRPPRPARGEGTCAALNRCFGECVSGDQTCNDACVWATSAAAVDAFYDVLECFDDEALRCAELPEADAWICRYQACDAELRACVGPFSEPAGALSCDEALSCADACQPGGIDRTTPCIEACVVATDVEAYPSLRAVWNCVDAIGCEDRSCVACETQHGACAPDPGDEGIQDGGLHDSGPTDTGPTDSGPTDSGSDDAASTDASPSDAGLDAHD